MEHEEKKTRSKKIILTVFILLLNVCLVIGIAYAYMRINKEQATADKILTTCLDLEMAEITNAIDLQYAYPLTDIAGETTEPYTFKITNKCYEALDYSVYLEVLDSDNRITSNNIAIKFDDDNKALLNSYTNVKTNDTNDEHIGVESYVLKTGTLSAKDSVTYNLRLWLDKDAGNDTQNSSFQSKISVMAEQSVVATYQEGALNGADPVIIGDLIPVNIADNGIVTKANLNEKWYSYQDKEWANAIILKDKTITYEDGATIPEDNIESYFVWIPKYSYQLWNLGESDSPIEISSLSDLPTSNAHTIPIKFGTIDTSDDNSGECTTPLVSGESGNCEVGDYMTHPAFINSGTNGLWVGKFETGYDGATTMGEAQVQTTDSSMVIVKPNVFSWRNNSLYNFFMLSYNYERDLDSHMMKNTEWGAVAYLSHSKYGINTEVAINSNTSCVTGCSGGKSSSNSSCLNAYNTTTGYKASTTGNITGIYDMNGGAWEYVAAYKIGTLGKSGFSDDDLTTYSDYLDAYNESSSITSYNYRILGDATGEMGPFYHTDNYHNNWYKDYARFINSDGAYFARGGGYYHSAYAGQFNFSWYNGSALSSGGSRIVLSI
jgi:hypothetical protein